MSYYQFITKNRNKFNSDKLDLTTESTANNSPKTETAADVTTIIVTIEALLVQKMKKGNLY
jgi:hypothetical protein